MRDRRRITLHGAGRTGRPIAFGLLLLALAASAATAQVMRTLDPGTRVRVRLVEAPSSIIAEIVATRPDTLILGRPASRIPSTIPLAVSQIESLEISDGPRQLAPQGALLGFIAGAGLVSAYNAIVQSQCFGNCPSKVHFLVGGAAGGVAGAIGFAFIRSERWVSVALPRRPPPRSGGDVR